MTRVITDIPLPIRKDVPVTTTRTSWVCPCAGCSFEDASREVVLEHQTTHEEKEITIYAIGDLAYAYAGDEGEWRTFCAKSDYYIDSESRYQGPNWYCLRNYEVSPDGYSCTEVLLAEGIREEWAEEIADLKEQNLQLLQLMHGKSNTMPMPSEGMGGGKDE